MPACQPTQETATRPLSIQKNGTWYTYGWDLTKNICETYRTDARIDLAYTYTPYGTVSPAHAYDQPFQWSSEYHDVELGLVYYNYRHYNPAMGRWMSRDRLNEAHETQLYSYLSNIATKFYDYLGDANIAKFNHYVTLRQEWYGATITRANIDILARKASKLSKINVYKIVQGIRVITDSSAAISGIRFRYFIQYECECDNGCFFMNINASKPHIKTDTFVMTPSVTEDCKTDGYSAKSPLPKNYDHIVKLKIQEYYKAAKAKCEACCRKEK